MLEEVLKLEPKAYIQDREVDPDDRRLSGPRYAVVVDKGFQAPFILGEGDTPEVACQKAVEDYVRYEPRKPTYEELETTLQTREHIDLIRTFLREMAVELLLRGESHDRSKLDRAEVDVFTEYTPRLKGMTYGSDEYNQCLKEMAPALKHHYMHNRHHPELFSQEEWKDIVGFEGHYEVSSHGNVRSIDRVVSRSGPQGDTFKKGQILNQYVTPKGYRRVQLRLEGNAQNYMVHRLVAEAFIPNPGGRPQVNHKDGMKGNNSVPNLEWATASENLQHAYEEQLRDGALKYVVTCEELGITTLGTEQMEGELKRRGYEKARASGIWSAMHREGKHLDLTFTGTCYEHWMNSPVRYMDLLDIIEMFVDWLAATKRHNDGDIYRSIQINRKRFGLPDELAQIFINTARRFERSHG